MRRRGVRAAAVGLSLATLVASGCSATHPGPAAKPTPTAGAPSSASPNIAAASLGAGRDALARRRCRAQIEHGDLVAPFWLDNEHFDPLATPRAHTPHQALAAYRSDPATRGFPRSHLHVAYAAYSVTWRKAPPEPVWIVVRYGVLSTPSMGAPMRVAMTAILDDQDLQSLAIIESLPSRCS